METVTNKIENISHELWAAAQLISGEGIEDGVVRIETILRENFTQKTDGPECKALIFHGPGHQSRTRCRLKGPHTIHQASYGSSDQLAHWEGDKGFSGYFDEPPTVENDKKGD